MAHLMSQPPSRSKQDVQLSSCHTYSYNENQIAPERQSNFFRCVFFCFTEKAHVSSYRYIWLPGLSLFCLSTSWCQTICCRGGVHFWPLPSPLIFNVPTNFLPTTTLLANASIPSIRSTLPSYYSTLYPPP